MLKDLAKKVLAQEIANDSHAFREKNMEIQQLRAQVEALQSQKVPTMLVSLDDLNPTEEEAQLFQELGENPVYQSMMEKMVVRAFYLASKTANTGEKQMDQLIGFRDGCLQITTQVINENQKKNAEQANHLTGELHTDKQ